jgi:hypothetical protein
MTGRPAEIPIALQRTPEMDLLEAHLQSRLSGRVRDFRLSVRGKGLILTGYAHTYYAKQLAQQAFLEATALPILANEIQVC